MIHYLKRLFYFPVAWYFRFWAGFRLRRWHPRIIVVTGSSGKTTLLHLLESQVSAKARYSHHANSSYGIPFDILGLHRENLLIWEWPLLVILAPLKSFLPAPEEKIYIVEADCDRPYEGKFLSEFLQPEVTLWISSSKTHAMNFPQPVALSIAHEFGYFLAHTQSLAIVNGDNELITSQLSRSQARIEPVFLKDLKTYTVSRTGTQFNQYYFPYLLPRAHFYALEMTLKLLDYLQLKPDPSFITFTLPPGRSFVFKGIKDTTIIDSTYNSNFDSLTSTLDLFDEFPADKKWAIIGDMLELGSEEQAEHQQIVPFIKKLKLERLILFGPRVKQYAYPQLKSDFQSVVTFEYPKQVLDYLLQNLSGGETILFKGARFLEGVIEHLLVDSSQARLLPRREKVWAIRRQQWGL